MLSACSSGSPGSSEPDGAAARAGAAMGGNAGTVGNTQGGAASVGATGATAASGAVNAAGGGAGSPDASVGAGSGGVVGSAGSSSGGSSGTMGSSGTGGSAGTPGSGSWVVPFKPKFIMGADLSWTLEDEAAGVTYYDASGTKKPLEQIFTESGFNYIRIRAFVNPSASDGYNPGGTPWNDTEHTVAWAKRVRACGLGILLDLHLSDTWASIGKQNPPAAWSGLSASAMQSAAHDYVKDLVSKMAAAGAEPDLVQVGNETSTSMAGVAMSNWSSFAALFNAAMKGVKDFDPKIIVLAQHGRPRDAAFETWIDKFMKGTPPATLDAVGGTTYGSTNNGTDITTEFSYAINNYKIPAIALEYSHGVRALINGVMHGLPNQMGLGTFIWEPTKRPSDAASQWLFDHSGNKWTANGNLAAYPTMAKSYGLPVPSGACH